MKLLFASLLCLATGASAFSVAPRASFCLTPQTTRSSSSSSALSMFFADKEKKGEELTMEEEIEMLVEEEKKKTMRMSNMRNANGVEYAPWMNISPEDEAKIRQTVREKTAARRKRRDEEQSVRGALMKDSTNQELSGTGLKSKVIGSDSVELEWATGSELNTRGFIVKRRAAKTEDFITLASYETFGPLTSKGVEGGVYRYLDDTVPAPGGWVYRVTECESDGKENDLSQCLVDVETKEEQQGQVIALAAIAAIAIAAVAAGTLLDPMQ